MALFLLSWSCQPDPNVEQDPLNAALEAAISQQPGGKSGLRLPQDHDWSAFPQDPRNPITAEKVQLGKLLFHETGLAINPRLPQGMNRFSCASCHHAGAGFQAGILQGLGEGGLGFGVAGESRDIDPNWPIDSIDVQPIRTPTSLNVAFQELMLWNGQFGSTGANRNTSAQWTSGTPKAVNHLGYEGPEIQAIAGLKVHRMEVTEAILSTYGYLELFDQVFPDFARSERYTKETAGLAIAAYERSVVANRSPFQQWLRGDVLALSEAQKRGAVLFFGKAACGGCHQGPALNSMEFYALGMNDLVGPGTYGTSGNAADNTNLGRGGFTGNPEEHYQFKVPQLYNLKGLSFLGHGGTFGSLREVVDYKNRAQAENAKVPAHRLASEFKALSLSDEEVDDLVEFLEEGLYDPNLERYVPATVYSGNCFPNADPMAQVDQGCL